MERLFHLDRVLDPQFYMPRGPELERVGFLSISLLPLAHDQLVTVDFIADIPTNIDMLHHRMAEYAPLEYLHIHRLTLEFQFWVDEPEIGMRNTVCKLTEPDQHNLTDAPHSQIVWRYLERWGLCSEQWDEGFVEFTHQP